MIPNLKKQQKYKRFDWFIRVINNILDKKLLKSRNRKCARFRFVEIQYHRRL